MTDVRVIRSGVPPIPEGAQDVHTSVDPRPIADPCRRGPDDGRDDRRRYRDIGRRWGFWRPSGRQDPARPGTWCCDRGWLRLSRSALRRSPDWEPPMATTAACTRVGRCARGDEFAPSCPQQGGPFAPPGAFDEDCLYLNVYTPTLGHGNGPGRAV